ncbi:MAG TPA: hypothetical protein VMT46_03490 [Anaerolineaceae bacterium]|nr:hypothetical protein [Anaerolineaceae bacterium]
MADLYQLSRRQITRARVVRLALLTAGVGLTHYLAATLLVAFAFAVGVVRLGENLRQRNLDLHGWLPLIAAPLTGLILGLPWFLRVWQFTAASVRISSTIDIERAAQSFTGGYAQYLWYLAGPQRNYWLLPLAAVGLLLALRPGRGLAFSLWSIFVALGCLPQGIVLAPFRPDLLVIIVFLPASLLAAHALVSAGEALGSVVRRPWAGLAAAGLAVLLLVAWGVRDTRDILNPVTILADQADLDALRWIEKNTPPDARFFINTTPWQGGTYRGVDGGAWILTLTGRWVLQPPVLFGMGSQGYVQEVNRWSKQASQLKSCDPPFWDLVKEAKINYLYLKTGSGSFRPGEIAACNWLKSIYDDAGIEVYKIALP